MRPPSHLLSSFVATRPKHEIEQGRSLLWLARMHALSEATRLGLDRAGRVAFEERLSAVLGRVACGPRAIARRGSVLAEIGGEDPSTNVIYDVTQAPHGAGTGARTYVFRRVVRDYFESAFLDVQEPPRDLIHVTCTGYVAPSGAQELAAKRGWGERTRVTHAYHMGCYAAFPALRMAQGALSAREGRVDIVHTELCSLHLDPGAHALEQLVVQSLFADGLIRYSVDEDRGQDGLLLLALDERLIADSADSMSWIQSDHGMLMTLARDVPARIRGELHAFVHALLHRAGLSPEAELPRAAFAIHPGGPRIIDAVCDVFSLTEEQARESREVLSEHGNMSSATLPHVWSRMLASPALASGSVIVSLAFGPGLTLCGGVMRKR